MNLVAPVGANVTMDDVAVGEGYFSATETRAAKVARVKVGDGTASTRSPDRGRGLRLR